MHGLTMLLTHILVGQVSGASNKLTHKVWWRLPIYFIILGAALWVAYSSAFLWESAAHPGVVGLLNYVDHGGPGWFLAIPLVALVVAFAGSLPAAGRFAPVFWLQFALFWLLLLGMAQFQGDGHSALNFAAVSCVLVTIPASLLAVVTGLADVPPVTSPLAPFSVMYMGRLGHLRALVASANRFGWEVHGPEGTARAYRTEGYYGDGRMVRVVSGGSWQGSPGVTSAADQGYWYKVTVTSRSALPTFEIARKKLPLAVVQRAVTGTVTGGLNPVRYYVIPPYGERPREEWVQRFAQQVASGAQYVRTSRDSVRLTAGGILYTHFRMMRLTAKDGAIEPLLDWMIGLARLLEEIAPPVEQVAPPAASSDFAPRLPYGQLSDVDPARRTW